MNPHDHARSSALRFGGCWEDYQQLHDWFDASKATLCHFLHRALRHHREGIAEAEAVFGSGLRNADGAIVPVETIGMQHLEEDCYRLPNASDWTAGFRPPEWWPAVPPAAALLADASACRFGGLAATYLPLHQWLLAPAAWNTGPAFLLFRHHAFGLFEAERRFGPVLGEGRYRVPTRVVGERHIQTVLGRVPPAADLLRRLTGERWMVRAAMPDSLSFALTRKRVCIYCASIQRECEHGHRLPCRRAPRHSARVGLRREPAGAADSIYLTQAGRAGARRPAVTIGGDCWRPSQHARQPGL